MTEDMNGLETTLFTSMSVAAETLERMVDQISVGPAIPGSVRLGYIKAACTSIRKELDLFLIDRDMDRMTTLNALMADANAQLRDWK